MAGKSVKKELPFGITFGEPPAPPQERRNDVFWTTVADTLRENPNKWARVKVYESKGGATGRANQINSGKSPFFPKPEFSARYVATPDGQFSELWVCFTPQGDN